MTDRREAVERLRSHIGADLRGLADEHGVTVFTDESHDALPVQWALEGFGPSPRRVMNKGWAGLTVERLLGLPMSQSPGPDLGDWELKTVPLRKTRAGAWTTKEPMALTMLDPEEVRARPRLTAHPLFEKIKRLIVVARTYEGPGEPRSLIHDVTSFRLDDHLFIDQALADYAAIRSAVMSVREGEPLSSALDGSIGVLLQARTKGRDGARSRWAFYARRRFVAAMLGLPEGDELRNELKRAHEAAGQRERAPRLRMKPKSGVLALA